MNKHMAQAGVVLLVVAGATAPVTFQPDTYDYEWTSEKTHAQTAVSRTPRIDASRNLGIYIPHMIWPAGKDAPISSGFGYRDAPCSVCSSMHMGLDFNPGYGSPVYSATDGAVLWVGNDGGSLGYNVVIQDPGTWEVFYGHMIEGSAPSDIVIGAKVKAGQQLGQVGNTGVSTGAHLHFEIQDSGIPVDPLPLLQKYAQ